MSSTTFYRRLNNLGGGDRLPAILDFCWSVVALTGAQLLALLLVRSFLTRILVTTDHAVIRLNHRVLICDPRDLWFLAFSLLAFSLVLFAAARFSRSRSLEIENIGSRRWNCVLGLGLLSCLMAFGLIAIASQLLSIDTLTAALTGIPACNVFLKALAFLAFVPLCYLTFQQQSDLKSKPASTERDGLSADPAGSEPLPVISSVKRSVRQHDALWWCASILCSALLAASLYKSVLPQRQQHLVALSLGCLAAFTWRFLRRHPHERSGSRRAPFVRNCGGRIAGVVAASLICWVGLVTVVPLYPQSESVLALTVLFSTVVAVYDAAETTRKTPAPSQALHRRLLWSRMAISTLGITVTCLALNGATRQLGQRVETHIDEDYWIGSTYYYTLLFTPDGLSHPDWQLLPARENPPIGKYLLGVCCHWEQEPVVDLDLLAAFYLSIGPAGGYEGGWGAGVEYDKRCAVVERASRELSSHPETWRQLIQRHRKGLRLGRRIAYLATLLTAASLILICLCLDNRTAAMMVGPIYVLQCPVVNSASVAMIDALATCFSAAAVLALIASWQAARLESRIWRRTGVYGGMLSGGVFLGCACGTKMNSLVVVALGAALLAHCLMSIPFRGNRRVEVRRAALSLGMLWIGLLIFVCCNPSLYSDPVRHMWELISQPQTTSRIQVAALGWTWDSPWSQVQTVACLASGSRTGLWWHMTAVLGTAAVFRSRERTEQYSQIIAWWGLACVLVVAWIPLPWDRYILPILPSYALLVSILFADGLQMSYVARLGEADADR